MSKDQATKRPWKIVKPILDTREYNKEATYIYGKNDDGWQMCVKTCENDLSLEEQLANAALIVKAVNCHDVLIDAINAAIEYDKAIQYQANKGKSWVQSDILDNLYKNWIDKSKQALKKAGAL